MENKNSSICISFATPSVFMVLCLLHTLRGALLHCHICWCSSFFLCLQRQQLIDSCIHAPNARAGMYSQTLWTKWKFLVPLSGNSQMLSGSFVPAHFVTDATRRISEMVYTAGLLYTSLPVWTVQKWGVCPVGSQQFSLLLSDAAEG